MFYTRLEVDGSSDRMSKEKYNIKGAGDGPLDNKMKPEKEEEAKETKEKTEKKEDEKKEKHEKKEKSEADAPKEEEYYDLITYFNHLYNSCAGTTLMGPIFSKKYTTIISCRKSEICHSPNWI